MMPLQIIAAVAFVLLGPLAGGLIDGLGRIVTARMQGRIGPPLFQPFYDFFKLLQKSKSMVDSAQSFYILFYLLFTVFSGTLFFLGSDLLLFFFSLMLANTFLILAGYSAFSPYSHLGTERELILMMLYEPIMILCIVGMFFLTGSFNAVDIAGSAIPIIAYLPGCFIGMIVVLCIKMQKSPFDLSMSHHAHQELVKGLTSDFSASILAMMELAHWYKFVFLFGFLFLFFGFQPAAGAVVLAASFLAVQFIDNIFARLKYQTIIRGVVLTALILVFGNITFLYILKTFSNFFQNLFKG
jgi:ech hydrogenase subunit B